MQIFLGGVHSIHNVDGVLTFQAKFIVIIGT